MTKHSGPSAGDYLFAGLQYLLPKHLLSRGIHALARSETPWLRSFLISSFLRAYTINLAEAAQSNPFSYASFNQFFTRALRSDARPIDTAANAFVSPVDGGVSRCDVIRRDTLIQAKGREYTLDELLAGDTEAVSAYQNGSFACLYLAPFNYHRIHMPYDTQLRQTVYVPGDLFSVNAATARAVPRLFARNERVICDFDSAAGRICLILVGALFVGSIETVLHGELNPPRRRSGKPVAITEGVGHVFRKGHELGRFNMGSTVVVLTQHGRVRWHERLRPDVQLRMGQRVADVTLM